MNKPRLTVAVKRGLRVVSLLASADLDADQSSDEPAFNKQQADEIRRALIWIAHVTAKDAALATQREGHDHE